MIFDLLPIIILCLVNFLVGCACAYFASQKRERLLTEKVRDLEHILYAAHDDLYARDQEITALRALIHSRETAYLDQNLLTVKDTQRMNSLQAKEQGR